MNDTPRTPPESFLLLKFGRSVYTRDGKKDGFGFEHSTIGLNRKGVRIVERLQKTEFSQSGACDLRIWNYID